MTPKPAPLPPDVRTSSRRWSSDMPDVEADFRALPGLKWGARELWRIGSRFSAENSTTMERVRG